MALPPLFVLPAVAEFEQLAGAVAVKPLLGRLVTTQLGVPESGAQGENHAVGVRIALLPIARQVHEIGELAARDPALSRDPCRLARQVNQIRELAARDPALSHDPCRLARQVNEIGELDARDPALSHDPCRLARQVNQTISFSYGDINLSLMSTCTTADAEATFVRDAHSRETCDRRRRAPWGSYPLSGCARRRAQLRFTKSRE
jgi:hypothetical protein